MSRIVRRPAHVEGRGRIGGKELRLASDPCLAIETVWGEYWASRGGLGGQEASLRGREVRCCGLMII